MRNLLLCRSDAGVGVPPGLAVGIGGFGDVGEAQFCCHRMAYDKIKMVPKGQRVVADGVLHRWFTDMFVFGLAEQARMLTHPAPPKREEELPEHVEMWQDKMRRLEAHGDEFKMPPAYKVNALRTFMAGKAKESFDLWEADRDNADPAKSYGDLVTKVKNHSRRRKLDCSAKERIQHGGDTMDVAAVGGWS